MKSKSSFIAVSLFGALFLLPYCDDDSPENKYPKFPDEFRYPLAIGNTWEYTRQWDSFFYADSAAPTYYDTTTYLDSIRLTIMDTVSGGGTSGIYQMASSGLAGLDSMQGAQYYGQDEDGLYDYGGVAYWSLAMPKRWSAGEKQAGIQFKGRYFSNVNELFRLFQDALPGPFPLVGDTTELTVEDPPLLVLQYPLEQGTTWTYRSAEDPWRIDKVVMGKEEVTVPAGAFECVKVKWLYDFDDDGEWDTDIFIEDYYGAVGLVEREITILGMEIRSQPGGHVGYMDSMDKYTLGAVLLEE